MRHDCRLGSTPDLPGRRRAQRRRARRPADGALLARRPELRFAGIGGPRMAEQGLATLFPMHELAVMGLLEVLPRLHRAAPAPARDRRRHRRAPAGRAWSPSTAPASPCACCARSRRSACRARITSRRRSGPGASTGCATFPGLWDRLLCLLPFEPAFFARHGLPATFVGHPVLESGADAGDAARFRARHGLAADTPC